MKDGPDLTRKEILSELFTYRGTPLGYETGTRTYPHSTPTREIVFNFGSFLLVCFFEVASMTETSNSQRHHTIKWITSYKKSSGNNLHRDVIMIIQLFRGENVTWTNMESQRLMICCLICFFPFHIHYGVSSPRKCR